MTFSEERQQRARDLFIEECRQKAWGACLKLGIQLSGRFAEAE
jgi:hypothetical protein